MSSHYKPINKLYQEWNKDYPKFSSPYLSPYFISITTRYQHDSLEAIGSFGHFPKLAPPQNMYNLTKLEFVALDISGNNYLSWILDAKIHLDASNLRETIKETNSASLQDRIKALIFLRHHLHESLKNEYLTVKDSLVLWQSLKD